MRNMGTYPVNTDMATIETVVSQLTAKGRETMMAIGNGELSFFDGGVVEMSGIWGECLVSEMGHKSSGVVNRLKDMGLFTAHDYDHDDAGMWWQLTSLGADVANYLAGNFDNRITVEVEEGGLDLVETPVETTYVNVKVGRKWITITDGEGNILAEVQKDLASQIVDLLQKEDLA